MLNYSIFINNKDVTDKFARYSQIYGTIFLILGLLGILFPGIMSLTSALFIGWLMLFGGILIGVQTWQVNKKDWLGWLKALLYLAVGAMIILNPLSGIIALGILITAYFFIDSFLNFILAFNIKPASNWWIVLLNAILSLAIGLYFLYAMADPAKTTLLVGIFVGISLFFDGVMLLTLASASKKES